jgi:hypothetical protein
MLRRGSPGILASHNSAGRPRSKKIVTRLLVFQAPTIESAKSMEVGFDAAFLRTRSEVFRVGVFDPDRFELDAIRRDYTPCQFRCTFSRTIAGKAVSKTSDGSHTCDGLKEYCSR